MAKVNVHAQRLIDRAMAAYGTWLKSGGDTFEPVSLDGIYKSQLAWLFAPGLFLYAADLSRADLSGANLWGANLSRADLSGANLSRADMSGAYLSRANMSGADMSGANMPGANMSGANMSGANLFGACLFRANLLETQFTLDKNLCTADFRGAQNFESAIFRTTDGRRVVGLTIGEDGKLRALPKPGTAPDTTSAFADAASPDEQTVHAADLGFVPPSEEKPAITAARAPV